MLAGRRAIVTGASKGIGFAIAQKLASLGCSVTMVARNEKLLLHNLSQLSIAEAQTHNFVGFDLADFARGKEKQAPGYSLLVESLKQTTYLVNCAGIATYSLLKKTSNETITNVIDLNLTAPILLSKLALDPMMRLLRKTTVTPCILNVSSMLSTTGLTAPGTSAYAALKAGLLGFSELLAAELNGRVRVNAALPVLVKETDMGKAASDKLKTVPLATVVDTCARILTDETLNGKFVPIDGEDCSPIN